MNTNFQHSIVLHAVLSNIRTYRCFIYRFYGVLVTQKELKLFFVVILQFKNTWWIYCVQIDFSVLRHVRYNRGKIVNEKENKSYSNENNNMVNLEYEGYWFY